MAQDGMAVEHISKTFGSNQVLFSVSFECRPGTVTGLLGPNGSGKTTTMRVMTGLTPADSGRATFDQDPYRRLKNPGRLVGVLLDPLAHHPGRSVRETMALAGMMMRLRRGRVDDVIDQAGLSSVAKRRFGELSVGMKQRVGLGLAILGEPKYLVLDEPMNGLDIEAHAWTRDFLADFAHRGGGVLIATHLLNELESLADEVVIINAGRVAYAGAMAGLRTGYGCVVRLAESGRLIRSLQERGIHFEYAGSSHELKVDASTRQVHRICVEQRIYLDELTISRQSLEEAYLRLTGAAPRPSPESGAAGTLGHAGSSLQGGQPGQAGASGQPGSGERRIDLPGLVETTLVPRQPQARPAMPAAAGPTGVAPSSTPDPRPPTYPGDQNTAATPPTPATLQATRPVGPTGAAPSSTPDPRPPTRPVGQNNAAASQWAPTQPRGGPAPSPQPIQPGQPQPPAPASRTGLTSTDGQSSTTAPPGQSTPRDAVASESRSQGAARPVGDATRAADGASTGEPARANSATAPVRPAAPSQEAPSATPVLSGALASFAKTPVSQPPIPPPPNRHGPDFAPAAAPGHPVSQPQLTASAQPSAQTPWPVAAPAPDGAQARGLAATAPTPDRRQAQAPQPEPEPGGRRKRRGWRRES
ncbi:MAG: ATP-binding cassette domain-containing protein [Propionibacteriaceae bacterium]|jgi:ABC-2 type transport system ATP-binding protein|nr:ATP-binding cassette domain-containing protein [Propionibacteriaceae bacterium]